MVTGGRRGIGRGVAFALADEDHDVVIIDLVDDSATQKTLEGVVSRGAKCRFLQCNIADVSCAESLCDAAFAGFGRVDVLVNNAGIQVEDRDVDVLHTAIDSYDRLMSVNLRGPFPYAGLRAPNGLGRRRWLHVQGDHHHLFVERGTGKTVRCGIRAIEIRALDDEQAVCPTARAPRDCLLRVAARADQDRHELDHARAV